MAASDTDRHNGKTPFPWWYSGLNVLLFFLIIRLGPMPWSHWYDTGDRSGDPLAGVLITIVLGLHAVLSLGYQAIVFYLFRGLLRNRVAWAVIFVLPALAFGLWLGLAGHHLSKPRVRASGILSQGRLAALPESATDIKVWRTEFSVFLRFQASREDIESFLAASPRLRDSGEMKCEVFSEGRMRLLRPPGQEDSDAAYPKDDPRYFTPSPVAPPWYDGTLKGPGRVYSEYAFELIVNEDADTVFVHLEF